jgi:8-oxo-dGTP pyrophosphatase MutT (NUDIX family)
MKTSVSLFLTIPNSNEVILSRRARHEKLPGLLQATIHGGIQDGEVAMDALIRELEEEAAFDFANIKNLEYLDEIYLEGKGEKCIYYKGEISLGEFKELQPGDEVDSFLLCEFGQIDDIESKNDFLSEDFFENLVMFDDELEVLHKITSGEI